MGRCSCFSLGEADHQRGHSPGQWWGLGSCVQGCRGLCMSTMPSFLRRCSQASRPSLASCCHWSFKGGRGSMGHGSKLSAPVLGPRVSCCVDWAWASSSQENMAFPVQLYFSSVYFISMNWLSVIWLLTIHSYVLGCLPFASVGSSLLCHTLESTGTFPLHTVGEMKGLD